MKRAVTFEVVDSARKKLNHPISRKRALEFALKWSRKKWEQIQEGNTDSYTRMDACGFCMMSTELDTFLSCGICFDEIHRICMWSMSDVEPGRMLKIFDEIEAKYTEWPEEGEK